MLSSVLVLKMYENLGSTMLLAREGFCLVKFVSVLHNTNWCLSTFERLSLNIGATSFLQLALFVVKYNMTRF